MATISARSEFRRWRREPDSLSASCHCVAKSDGTIVPLSFAMASTIDETIDQLGLSFFETLHA
jgi:hypothetical protein